MVWIIEPISEFAEKVSELAKQLYFKLHPYANNHEYYDLKIILDTITKINHDSFPELKIESSDPKVVGDILCFMLFISSENTKETRKIFMEFNKNSRYKFYLEVISSEGNVSPVLYDNMDSECVNLVKALNKLPGIRTLESCCGHGKSKYRIFFKQQDNQPARGLAYLGRLMSRRYAGFSNDGWSIVLDDVCDSFSCGIFLLEGPMGEDAYEDAEEMAEMIERAIEKETWPLSTKES